VFRITGPPDEDRREPTLASAPHLPPADPWPLDLPERLARVRYRGPGQWRGPFGSLVLHLLPLLLLVEWPMAAPPEMTPIAVQLVVEPPPPEPQPVPPRPEFKPPPPGHIASDDIGDPEAKKAGQDTANPPAAKDASPPETPPSEAPQQTAAIVPPPPPPKPDPPKPQPKPNPNPAAQKSLRSTEEPAHTAERRARYPGPAASRDEYLAYVHSLIRQHYNMLPLAMVGDRRGETQVEFVVLDDGTIATIRLRQSSGWPDIDARVEMMIAAVRRVPPLPQWFQGASMGLVLNLPFPDALRE
jgi:outer membrane biosynthesis protein TonB